MLIPLDNHIPIPPARVKYDWANMKVGSSFWVEGKKPSTMSPQIARQEKLRGWTFRVAAENGGTRVWRLT